MPSVLKAIKTRFELPNNNYKNKRLKLLKSINIKLSFK